MQDGICGYIPKMYISNSLVFVSECRVIGPVLSRCYQEVMQPSLSSGL